MSAVVNTDRTSFASGEICEELHNADDLQRYKTGAEIVENLVVRKEGVLTRSPGTGFVEPFKDESRVGRFIPFRYSATDYYMMHLNGGKMRLLKNGGIVLSDLTPFELSTVWTDDELPKLRAGVSGNRVFIASPDRSPRMLTRNDHTDWTDEIFEPLNGPVGVQNLDTTVTVKASAVEGAGVALLGANDPFDTGWVGAVMRIDEPSQSIVPLWQVDEDIALPTEALPNMTTAFGDVTPLADADDGDLGTSADRGSHTNCYFGREFTVATPILQAVVSPSNSTVGRTMTISLYGSNSLPAHRKDGALLGFVTKISVNNETVNVHNGDPDASYTFYWVVIQVTGQPLLTNVGFREVAFERIDQAEPKVFRRWQSNVYQAITAGSSGLTAPLHTSGDFAAGEGAVIWRYVHSGYGFVKLTAVADANHATATVLSRLPDTVVNQPTYRWSPPAWNDVDGWPDNVIAHDQRLEWIRKDSHWFTQPGTSDNFLVTSLPDSAIPIRLTAPDGALVETLWAYSQGGVVLLGTRDLEWILRAPQNSDALTLATIRPVPDTKEGSIEQVPAAVDKGVIFIGRSGQRMHYAQFNYLTNSLAVNEVSAAAGHVLGAGAIKVAWQRDPHRICWGVDAAGQLFGVTFMPEEKIIGWHRHPRAGFIEDISSIPASDNKTWEVYVATLRTIDNETHRYIEIFKPFFAPINKADRTAAGAWFVECGIRYQGAPETTITGLDHLEGEVVAVFADGAEQKRQTVSDGAIELEQEASDVVVGLPIKWRFKDLPRNVMLQTGTTKGELKRASHLSVNVLNAAGGKYSINGGELFDLIERGDAELDKAVELVTGSVRATVAGDTQEEVTIVLEGDNALPFTMRGITPKIEFEEQG